MKRTLIQILFPIMLLLACLGFVACDKKLPERLPEVLDTPQNLKVENGILTWDRVLFADGYYVYIDDDEHQTTECSYDLTDLSADIDHTIKVLAYSNHEKIAPSKYVGFKYTSGDVLINRGFAFEQIGNTKTYQVTKFAVDEKGVCVIPSSYNGATVKRLKPDHDDPSVQKVKKLYLPNTIAPSNYDPALSFVGFDFAIQYFGNLESIELEPGSNNKDYFVEGNCLIKSSTHTLLVGGLDCVIPDSVTTIGDFAFGWRNITELTVPDFITEIGGSAFIGCKRLTEITLPAGITRINMGTFTGCSSLKSIELPESVTTLETWAFWQCSALESIVLPSGLYKVGQGAFEDCSALKQIVIPASVRSLLRESFRNCTSLTSVVILGDIKIIDSDTFAFCTSLKSIVIPGSVTSVSYDAFKKCALDFVYYGATEADWEKIVIRDTENDALVNALRYYYSETQPTKSGRYWHFVDGVPTQWRV